MSAWASIDAESRRAWLAQGIAVQGRESTMNDDSMAERGRSAYSRTEATGRQTSFARNEVSSDAHEDLPELLVDRSFWGIIVTQFLGAFNDNLYKQLMLLLALPVALVAGAEATGQGQQADVQGGRRWCSPCLCTVQWIRGLSFRSPQQDAGDRAVQVAEIAIMALGLLAFLMYGQFGQAGTWIVLFLMGTQKRLLWSQQIWGTARTVSASRSARANALMLMSTFLAIILGIVAAGVLRSSSVENRRSGCGSGCWSAY